MLLDHLNQLFRIRSVPWLHSQATPNQLFQITRNIRIHIRNLSTLCSLRNSTIFPKRNLTCCKFIKRCTKSPNISCYHIDRILFQAFIRHIGYRTIPRRVICFVGTSAHGFTESCTDAEICYHHLPISVYQHIAWFNILVNDVMLVNISKTCSHLSYEIP